VEKKKEGGDGKGIGRLTNAGKKGGLCHLYGGLTEDRRKSGKEPSGGGGYFSLPQQKCILEIFKKRGEIKGTGSFKKEDTLTSVCRHWGGKKKILPK